MKIIIAGSTGMIGSLILQNSIESTKVKEIITLVRKPSKNALHQKVKEVIVNDFTDYTGHADEFQNVDAAYFCIGVYTGQVSDNKFKLITVDYAVDFAKELEKHSPQSTYCLLSGQGADRTEKSRTSFARYKGMAENQISELDLIFHTFRPGYIYPVTPRNEPNLMYRVSRFLYPVIKLMGSNTSVPSTDLARAMFLVGTEGGKLEVYENRDIKEVLEY